LERIVKVVLKEVESEPFEVAKYPVGLDQAVKEINDEIQKQSQVNGATIVGIARNGRTRQVNSRYISLQPESFGF
jgi:hypothetical protein